MGMTIHMADMTMLIPMDRIQRGVLATMITTMITTTITRALLH